MTEQSFYVGVDVGTGSARAGVFDRSGRLYGIGVQPFETWNPEPDFYEQSSDQIWDAVVAALRAALESGDVDPAGVAGVGFDAACSLVVLDADGAPVTVSRSGDDDRNVIVWMDHRATEQAAAITRGGDDVLRYVGGVMSPEMQTPKLLWLKQNMPQVWQRAGGFFDLADFLAWRATGISARSLCTTVCKWTYVASETRGAEPGWRAAYFEAIGLGDLAEEGYARIGSAVSAVGDLHGPLSEEAADQLGLRAGIAVAVPVIDAHAGGIGLLGTDVGDGEAIDLSKRLALICGTSTCHMAVSPDPRYVEGVWGPYYSALLPGMWLTEGGQTATGALLDHVIGSHHRGEELAKQAAHRGVTVHDVLNEQLEQLTASLDFPAAATRDLHVLPYFHGNRSPRADASLRGMVAGLSLDDSVDGLAVLYLAAIQSLAYGTRHILESLNGAGYAIDTMIATGGSAHNDVYLREHADATGCRIILPKEAEAVLLGAAMLAASAAGAYSSVAEAMEGMSGIRHIVEPAGGAVGEYHHKKYAVFKRMYDDFTAYRALMA